MVLCCFQRIRGQSTSFRVGLGAYPWRTETDATDLDIYRSLGRCRHIFADFFVGHFSGTKTTLKMSPNMTCEALQSFSPRLTVAKRKEALELRKVSGTTDFCFNVFYIFSDALHLMYWMNAKFDVFFSDYETFDGKKKARTHQRQPEPFEKPHPSPHRQRCKWLYTFKYKQEHFQNYWSQSIVYAHMFNICFLSFFPEDSLLQAWESRHPRNDCEVPQRHSLC